MAYDRYLALGWPIATGVIEGTCRHLVKDRCERSGHAVDRHGGRSAPAVTKRRAEWGREVFDAYRRAERHRDVYGVSLSQPSTRELRRLRPILCSIFSGLPNTYSQLR